MGQLLWGVEECQNISLSLSLSLRLCGKMGISRTTFMGRTEVSGCPSLSLSLATWALVGQPLWGVEKCQDIPLSLSV